MFGVAPVTFDSVDVFSTFRAALLFADDNVATAHPERRIGLPLVGVVETARRGLRNDFFNDFSVVTRADRRDADDPITLENAENDDLAGCAPTTQAGAMSAEGGLVELEMTEQGFTEVLSVCTSCSGQPVEPLSGRCADLDSKAQAVDRHAENEALQQPGFGRLRQAAEIPDFARFGNDSTICAFNTTIGEPAGPVFTAFKTLCHNLYQYRIGTD